MILVLYLEMPLCGRPRSTIWKLMELLGLEGVAGSFCLEGIAIKQVTKNKTTNT